MTLNKKNTLQELFKKPLKFFKILLDKIENVP